MKRESRLVTIFLIFAFFVSSSIIANITIKRRVKKIISTSSNAMSEWSISAYDLTRDKPVMSIEGNRWRMPASILKIVTAYAAIRSLGPDFRFATEVKTNGQFQKNKILKGDLIIYGKGDPSWSFRFYDDDFRKGPEAFVERLIKYITLKKIDGDIVCDDTYFLYKPYGPSWSWEVFQWGYGVKVSALCMNDNLMRLKIYPTRDGALVKTETIPSFYNKSVHCETLTNSKSVIDDLVAYKPFDSDDFFLSGMFPLSLSSWSLKIAVSDPAQYFGKWIKFLLMKRGVKVTGKVRVRHRYHYRATPPIKGVVKQVVSIKGLTLKEILKPMLKKSVNLYAELLLRIMGKKNVISDEGERVEGIKHVYSVLNDVLRIDKNIHMCDGSGLSRRNLITTNMMVRLLARIYASPQFKLFKELLPASGVDGTLKNELNGFCRGKVFAKTGQIEQVNSIAGFIHTRCGHWLAFCIVVNNHPSHKWQARKTIASITKILCRY